MQRFEIILPGHASRELLALSQTYEDVLIESRRMAQAGVPRDQWGHETLFRDVDLHEDILEAAYDEAFVPQVTRVRRLVRTAEPFHFSVLASAWPQQTLAGLLRATALGRYGAVVRGDPRTPVPMRSRQAVYVFGEVFRDYSELIVAVPSSRGSRRGRGRGAA